MEWLLNIQQAVKNMQGVVGRLLHYGGASLLHLFISLFPSIFGTIASQQCVVCCAVFFPQSFIFHHFIPFFLFSYLPSSSSLFLLIFLSFSSFLLFFHFSFLFFIHAIFLSNCLSFLSPFLYFLSSFLSCFILFPSLFKKNKLLFFPLSFFPHPSLFFSFYFPLGLFLFMSVWLFLPTIFPSFFLSSFLRYLFFPFFMLSLLLFMSTFFPLFLLVLIGIRQPV